MTDGMIVIETGDRVHMAGPVELLGAGPETAAVSWASDSIVIRPDFGYLVGRYVMADQANRNGHIFPLEDLRVTHQTVVHTPVNMVHDYNHVVGTFIAARLFDAPTPASAALADELDAMAEEARGKMPQYAKPHVQTAAAIWKYAFPGHYKAIQAAFDKGALWQSMESVPQTVTCKSGCADGEGTFPFQGPPPQAGYCEHINRRMPRTLDMAHFTGGGIIIPPVRPGWTDADVTEVAKIVEAHIVEAEQVYDAVSVVAPHLDSAEWEAIMGRLLAGAFGPVPILTATQERAAAIDVPAHTDGIIGVHHTPTTDGPWDHDLARKRLHAGDDDNLLRAFAWYDVTAPDPDGDGLPDAKDAWKFVHHDVAADGSAGPANIEGCRTGIGYLNGARNGTTIPPADHHGVWEHLAAHLADAELTPPPLHDDADADADAEAELDESEQDGARGYSLEQRRALLAEGKALPGLGNGPPRFPIDNLADLKDAIRTFGLHKGSSAVVRNFIMQQARRLGHMELIPAKWMKPMRTVQEKADYSPDEREQLLAEGKALPGLNGAPPRFPINTVADLRRALRAFGRHGGPDATVRNFIIARARALGRAELIPPAWTGEQADATEVSPGVLGAYRQRLEDCGVDMLTPGDSAPSTTSYPIPGGLGTLWQLADGWGEWYFVESDDGVRWLAQKWADVAHYDLAEEVGWTNGDVRKLGWDDKAWAEALVATVAGEVPSAFSEDARLQEVAAEGAGVIVAVVPPAAIAAQLAELGDEESDELHITLAFLGNVDGDVLHGENGKDFTVEQLTAAVGVFAAAVGPVHASVSGLGRFALPDGDEVTYASVDAPGLGALRARLVAALSAVGVPVAAAHDFTPHISLAFADPGEGPTVMPGSLSWLIEDIQLWWQDEQHTFPLRAGAVPA